MARSGAAAAAASCHMEGLLYCCWSLAAALPGCVDGGLGKCVGMGVSGTSGKACGAWPLAASKSSISGRSGSNNSRAFVAHVQVVNGASCFGLVAADVIHVICDTAGHCASHQARVKTGVGISHRSMDVSMVRRDA